MALNFGEESANVTSPNNGKAAKPKTKVWLNIGIQKGDTFVNLPYGLAIDTMDTVKMTGSPEWVKLSQARNKLLKMLIDAGLEIPAGGEEIVTGLVIKLKHSSETEIPDEDENDLADFGGFTVGKPEAAAPKGKAKALAQE